MAGAGAGSEGFDLGLFFDNSADYRKDVTDLCKKITAIVVDETPAGEEFGIPISYHSKYNTMSAKNITNDEIARTYRSFVEGLSEKGKAAASIIQKLITRTTFLIDNELPKENYDPRSGIQEGHVTQLKAWVTENRGKKLAVIFDFDRTLTMMEGGYFTGSSVDDWKKNMKSKEKKVVFNKYYGYKGVTGAQGLQLYDWYWTNPKGQQIKMPIPESKNIRSFLDTFTAEGYAEYLAGSHKRLLMLQEMFDFLYENGVTCFVLTNNDACVDSKGLLQELVQVFTKGRPIEILCGKVYNYKKSDAIKAHDKLKSLCGQSGGRKTRRIKKKKSKTRKH